MPTRPLLFGILVVNHSIVSYLQTTIDRRRSLDSKSRGVKPIVEWYVRGVWAYVSLDSSTSVSSFLSSMCLQEESQASSQPTGLKITSMRGAGSLCCVTGSCDGILPRSRSDHGRPDERTLHGARRTLRQKLSGNVMVSVGN